MCNKLVRVDRIADFSNLSSSYLLFNYSSNISRSSHASLVSFIAPLKVKYLMCEWWNASWCSIFSVLSLFKSMRWRHLLDIVARITTTLSSARKISILGLKNIMDKVKDYSFLVNLPFSIFSFQVLIFIRRVARSIINAFKLSAIFRLFSTAKFTLIFALAMLLSRFSFLGAAADGWFILSYFVSFDFKYSSVGACEFVVYFAQDF